MNPCHWYFTSNAAFALVALSFALVPLPAQTPDASGAPGAPTAPPVETDNLPIPKPGYVVPTESAATVISDTNLTPSQLNALTPSAAGTTPVIGPGSLPSSDLGDTLNSAQAATRLPFRITASISETYDNNIFASEHKIDDYITRAGFTGEVQLGALVRGQEELENVNYLDAIYSPTLRNYSNHSAEDGVDQNVDVIYAHRWTKLTLSLEQIYSSIQSTNASIGGLVTTDTYKTTIAARYAYSPKIDFYANLRQTFTDYDQADYTDSKEWYGEFYGLYHFDPKLSVGLGPRIGYLDLEDAPAERYEQVLARSIYVQSEKLTLKANAGAELREYQTYKRSSTLEPIFEFTADCLPTPSSNLSLNAQRLFTPSYGFGGDDYIATRVYFAATQRFFDAYFLGLKLGYENDDYAFNQGSGPTRRDNYYYFQPSIYWRPNNWLQIGAFDKYEEDSSNFTAFSYNVNQLGVSCSATY